MSINFRPDFQANNRLALNPKQPPKPPELNDEDDEPPIDQDPNSKDIPPSKSEVF